MSAQGRSSRGGGSSPRRRRPGSLGRSWPPPTAQRPARALQGSKLLSPAKSRWGSTGPRGSPTAGGLPLGLVTELGTPAVLWGPPHWGCPVPGVAYPSCSLRGVVVARLRHVAATAFPQFRNRKKHQVPTSAAS